MSYKEWVVQQPDDLPPEQLAKAYEAYKEEHRVRSTRRFVDEHKGEDWFITRYHPLHIRRARIASLQGMAERLAWLASAFKESRLELELTRHLPQESKDKSMPVPSDSDAAMPTAEGESKVRERFLRNAFIITPVPAHVPRDMLVKALAAQPGFRRMLLTDVDPSSEYMRQGFAFFDTQQTCEEAFLKLSGHKLDNGWSLRLRAKDRETSRKQAPSIMANPERLAKDADQAIRLARHFDEQKRSLLNGQSLDTVVAPHDLAEMPLQRRFNLVELYLREVHCFDYYSATAFLDIDRLFAVVGDFHDVAPAGPSSSDAAAATNASDSDFAAKLDLEIERLLSEEKVEEIPPEFPEYTTECTEPAPEESLTPVLAKHIEAVYAEKCVERAAGKFRCGVDECTKMFKAPSFVHKHIHNKHPEVIAVAYNKAVEVETFENYVNDPDHPTEADQMRPGKFRIVKAHGKGNIPQDVLNAAAFHMPSGSVNLSGQGPLLPMPSNFGNFPPGGKEFGFPGMHMPFDRRGDRRGSRQYGQPMRGGRTPGPYARARDSRPVRHYDDLDMLYTESVAVDYGDLKKPAVAPPPPPTSSFSALPGLPSKSASKPE